MDRIRVLVVDDEPLIAEAHRAYTGKVAGFEVVAVAHTAREAMTRLRAVPVDLVLLDLNLPDKHGLEIARALRAAGSGTDVLAVTSNRDIAMIRQAVALGVTHYLLKPFTFAAFRDRLDGYARYRRQLLESDEVAAQHEVDRVFATLRGPGQDTLPKGLDPRTFDRILAALRSAGSPSPETAGPAGLSRPAGLSAAEVAGHTGTSRVTARRYLEHLADAGRVVRSPRYGGPGRPEVEYRPAPGGTGSP